MILTLLAALAAACQLITGKQSVVLAAAPIGRQAHTLLATTQATDPGVLAGRQGGKQKPTWLQERAETSRRAAKHQLCPKCDADTLVGPDHDTCALTARVDPTPVDLLTEVVALLAGRQSYDLDRGALCIRQSWHHHSTRRPHPVLLEHRCTETRLF